MKNHAESYNKTIQFEYPNMIVRVHIPDLDEKERAHRMRLLMKATETILRSYERK